MSATSIVICFGSLGLVQFLLGVLQVMFYTLAVVTFGMAVPAGQFVPGIMIGSTYGRLVGIFVVNSYGKGKLNIEEGTWVSSFIFYFCPPFFPWILSHQWWMLFYFSVNWIYVLVSLDRTLNLFLYLLGFYVWASMTR